MENKIRERGKKNRVLELGSALTRNSWHRYGYKNVDELESVVDGYAAANIPLEVMWNDIDYMDGYRDFTLDKLNYALPKMQSYIQRLHDSNQRWVPIIDPGIMVDPGYPAYDAGIQKDVFLKDASGERYAGKASGCGSVLSPRCGVFLTCLWMISIANRIASFLTSCESSQSEIVLSALSCSFSLNWFKLILTLCGSWQSQIVAQLEFVRGTHVSAPWR